MTPTLVRYNNRVYSFASCGFFADNFPLTGFVAGAHEQKRDRPPVSSNIPGAAPLGMPTGKYSLTFTIRMLREDAAQFEAYLASKVRGTNETTDINGNPLAPASYGDATFAFTASLEEPSQLAPHGNPITVSGQTCTVNGKSDSYDEGIDELVVDYTFGCLQITESDSNGTRTLFSSNPSALDAMGQDYVTIGTDRSPGKATILNLRNPKGWDKRLGYGLNKATLIPSGDPPAEFEIRFEIWTATDLELWNAFAKKWLKKSVVAAATSPNSTNPLNLVQTRAISVQHPMLQAQPFSVQDCVVGEPGALEKDEYGVWSCTTKFIEWALPVIAQQAPTAAIPPAANPQPTAQNAVDAANLAAQKELEEALAGPAQQILASYEPNMSVGP